MKWKADFNAECTEKRRAGRAEIRQLEGANKQRIVLTAKSDEATGFVLMAMICVESL
jgi:hypothetical protein